MSQESFPYKSIELPCAPPTLTESLRAGSDNRQIRRGIVANHKAWFRLKATARGGEVRAVPGGGILAAAPDEMDLAFPRIPNRNAGEYLDRFVELCRERQPKHVGCWAADEQGYGTVGARLAARGFDWGWQSHWMSLDLSRLDLDFPTPDGLVIEADDSASWEVEELPYHSNEEARALMAAGTAKPRRLWRFAARLNGAIVGQSVLLVSAGRLGVGGIYNVGVVPAARNQGIGRAISAAACVAAKRLGCCYATLNAATHIYDRLGFQTVGHGQTWWLSRERLQHLPSREEIAFAESVGIGDIAGLEVTKRLPDLDAPLACGLRPVELAAKAGKSRSIRWLTSKGATLHVLDAWDLGWKEEAARLLGRQPELANYRSGQFHFTPLHAAAMRGDEELAALLLTAKPDLTICDREYDGTALGWANHFHRERIAAMIKAASQ